MILKQQEGSKSLHAPDWSSIYLYLPAEYMFWYTETQIYMQAGLPWCTQWSSWYWKVGMNHMRQIMGIFEG